MATSLHTKNIVALSALALLSALSFSAQADKLADIKAAGVVKVATFDANPPFGAIDPKTHDIVGYDVDFAKALAKSLGVDAPLVDAVDAVVAGQSDIANVVAGLMSRPLKREH